MNFLGINISERANIKSKNLKWRCASLSQEKQGLRWLKGNENAVIEDDFGKTTGNWSWIV